MQKVSFISYYRKFNTDIFNELTRKLQDEYNCKIVNDDSFDTVIFSDLNQELYTYAQNWVKI